MCFFYLNGILYMFDDSIVIKGPFQGGNVGQKLFLAFCVYKLLFLRESSRETIASRACLTLIPPPNNRFGI